MLRYSLDTNGLLRRSPTGRPIENRTDANHRLSKVRKQDHISLQPVLLRPALSPYASKAKTCFQSSFMLMTNQPSRFASS